MVFFFSFHFNDDYFSHRIWNPPVWRKICIILSQLYNMCLLVFINKSLWCRTIESQNCSGWKSIFSLLKNIRKRKHIQWRAKAILLLFEGLLHEDCSKIVSPILSCWPMTAAVDVGGMAVEAEQYPVMFCDSVTGGIWHNGVWNGSAYEAKVCHWISACRKNCTQ